MAKRFALVGAMFLLASLAAFAGDVAQFVNLGFSSESRYFMFGQFGTVEQDSTPWAESYIVDMAANSFAPRGTRQFTSTQRVDPGASGIGALISVLDDGIAIKKQYHIDHLATGRLLYILVDGEQAADSLEFRDFQTGRSYKVGLTQSVATNGAVTSSFSIAVTVVEKDGKTRSLTLGDSSYRRFGVKAYHIKQIILAPDGGSLVFLVQKEQQDKNGVAIRYMVETARVK